MSRVVEDGIVRNGGHHVITPIHKHRWDDETATAAIIMPKSLVYDPERVLCT